MPLLAKYQHSYRGITISGGATALLPVVRNHYLRCRCTLIYNFITEAQVSQSAEVGFAEGDAPLLSDAIVPSL